MSLSSFVVLAMFEAISPSKGIQIESKIWKDFL